MKFIVFAEVAKNCPEKMDLVTVLIYLQNLRLEM